MRFPRADSAIFSICLVILVSFAFTHEDASTGTSGVAAAASVADLQEQLERGLLARRPVELAFIQRVVTLVQTGRLPLGMVKSTFQWARPKKPRPFPYFERAIRVRAAQIGVPIQGTGDTG